MKFITLNLRHGGGKRIAALGEYLLASHADVIVCSEFRANAQGEHLAGLLKDGGYKSFHAQRSDGKSNSVCIATKTRSRRLKLEPAPVDTLRILGCEVDGLTVLGVYFAGKKDKASLFDYLLAGNPGAEAEKLVIGDFNTGRHEIDEAQATFYCEDRFRRLTTAGFRDLWRSSNGEDAREFTWTSPTGGHFRLDHAFGTAGVEKRLVSCFYDHSTRPLITDHSCMILTLRDS